MALQALFEDGLDRTWQGRANCMGVDPDLFFPERGASTREAKEVCRGCVVREDCLEYALANGEKFGIWGGLSERERRRLRRQRPDPARRASTVRSGSRSTCSHLSRGVASTTAAGAKPTSSARVTQTPTSRARRSTSS